ncbi:hypothetical protein [Mycolicibacterium sp. HS_4_1]
MRREESTVVDMDNSDPARRLREELLYAGLADWVSLAEANSIASTGFPELPEEQRRELVVNTLRAMVVNGLFVAGGLDTSDGKFAPFDEPLEQTVANIRSTYVEQYDTARWAFRFWFDLTDRGTAEATSTERGRELARGIDEDLLRRDILACGRAGGISLADVRGCLNRRALVTVPADRPQLFLDAIRSLLAAGFVEVGDLPGPDGPGFLAWLGGTNVVMEQLAARIIGQWAHPEDWEYKIWLNLTDAGRAAANRIPPAN